MTGHIDNLPIFDEFEADVLENLGWGIKGIDADTATIESEGNVLGQGILWEAVGGSDKPFHASRGFAYGQYIPGAQTGFIQTSIGLMYIYRGDR